MTIDLNSILEEYPFTPKRLKVSGGNLSYLDEGSQDKKAVVMLHGNPTWSFYYRKLVLALRSRFRVIVPDHIGCGLSDKPQSYDYHLGSHIENLRTLLDHLDLDDITLVVHDWGGAIGMGYAVDYPQKIKSLVLFNTAAFTFHRIPFSINICRTPLLGPILVRGLNAFAGPAINLKMATNKPERFTDEVKRGYLDPYDSWANRIAILRFVQDIPMASSHRSYELLRSIESKLENFKETPSLIMWGMRDFCFNVQFLDEWRKRLCKADVHMFEDAGHYIVEDAHEQIEPLFSSFIERTL